MKLLPKVHNFHIPVMGLAFTIDSPMRVAQYGIDSVISIMDDDLIEKMRKFYAEKFQQPYEAITTKIDDYRAKRITSYLDLLDQLIQKKFDAFKEELSTNSKALDDFFSILPTSSTLKEKLENFIQNKKDNLQELKEILNQYFAPGSIDTNIMTKVDKDNFKNGNQLPVMYNDAHAALRGFANSTTSSSVIFSAGMNPRLYSYMESFDQFYPNEAGQFKKKIILKVSDYRSAMVQGNFLAKKGLWVSEYRIESGLNCGGHAFATNGLLMGPIMEEFKTKKEELAASAYQLFSQALASKGRIIPAAIPEIQISVQGGVGTAEEHQFFLSHYDVNSVGWGSPFLLVPEATSVDIETRKLLAAATEKDLYLSNISPLGVPFNTIKGTTNEYYKNKRIVAKKAGSSCPKKYLALSKDYDQKEGICTASKKYQDIKISELDEKIVDKSSSSYQQEYAKITEKACLCVGLANSAQLELDIPVKGQKQGVVICPGPNIAYFSKEASLKEMIQHIYGASSIENHDERPNVFVKELQEYIKYLKNEIHNAAEITTTMEKKWDVFRQNLLSGISYYKNLLTTTSFFKTSRSTIYGQLDILSLEIETMEYGVLV